MKSPNCAFCTVPQREKLCRNPEGKGYEGCPTALQREAVTWAREQYENPEVKEFARQAALQEASGYANRHDPRGVVRPVKPRIQEICEFAHRMGYTRLGLAYCTGLQAEANMVAKILTAQGFEVVSVVCKVGRVPKEELGLGDNDKVRCGQFESMCNPIAQARLLNEAKTEFNVLLGLCVGHDSLFFKYAEAPTTVLAVKDRLLGHNPLAALYTSGSYYSFLTQDELLPGETEAKTHARDD